MVDLTPNAWSIGQIGRHLVVELCQFVFLLRLVAAVFVIFQSPDELATLDLALLLTSCILALVGTFILHRMVDTVRAHPLVVGADLAVAAAGLYVSDDISIFFVLSLFSAVLVGLLYKGAAAALLMTLLVVAYVGAALNDSPVPAAAQLLSSPLMFLATYAGGRVLVARVEQLTDQGLAASRAMSSLQERSRLAREMHDGVVKTLHGIALSAGALGTSRQVPDDLRHRFDMFASAAEHGVQQARETLVELRVDQDDRPFRVVVDEVVGRWSERVRVPATTEVGDLVDLDEPVRSQALACLREALDNVSEHAEATQVSVTCEAGSGEAIITVTDDGKGVDPRRLTVAARQGHFGVRGMHERMESIGGHCRVVPVPTGGTAVQLAVPFNRAEAATDAPA